MRFWRRLKSGVAAQFSLLSWCYRSCYAVAPKQTVLHAIMGVLSGLSPVVLLLGIRGLIDAQVSLSAAGELSLAGLAPWLILILGVAVVEATVVVGNNFTQSRLLAAAELHFTTQVLEQAGRLPPAFFDLASNQDDLSELRGNVGERIVDAIGFSTKVLVASLQCLTLAAVLVSISPVVLIVVGPLFLPYLVFQRRLGKWRTQQAEAQREPRRWIGYYVSLLMQRNTAAEIRLLGIAPHVIGRFREVLIDVGQEGREADWKDFKAGLSFALLALLGLLLVFANVVSGAVEGSHSIGDVVLFAAAMVRIRTSLELLARSVAWWTERSDRLEVMREFLSHEPNEGEVHGAQAGEFRADVRFRGVSFTYPGTAEPALREIDLDIHPGETVAIVGENGSGKSTLVKLLAGIYRDYEGQIQLGDSELSSIPVATIQGNVSFVFQNFGRYAATVAENIAYGNWKTYGDDPEAVEALAKRCGLEDALEQMPEGIDTLLGREFGSHDPSGGTWQKIAIARAFAHPGSLLILDEPTASVDLRTEYELFRQMGDLARGRTTVMITHRFSTVAVADRIFVMHRGRLVEQGTHDELIAQGGRYSELYSFYAQGMQPGLAGDVIRRGDSEE